MKTVFFEATKLDRDTFTELLQGININLVFFDEKLDRETSLEKIKDAEIVSVFVGSEINKDILDALPNLKYIVTRSTGFDHIDFEYAENKGIKVSNVPAYGSDTVAEFTFALILSLSRKVHDAYDHLKSSGYSDVTHLKGFDLRGKTLGVVGTGKIGKNVIRIAKGFGMNVIAYDLYPDLNYSKEQGFEYKSLNQVASEADILTLHTPYTKENHHLINKEILDMTKKGVYIINTARGELLDTDALVSLLKDGRIAGAGLDVLEGEKEMKDEPSIITGSALRDDMEHYKTLLENKMLLDMENVIVTPHIAFNTNEAVYNIMKTTAENIKSFIAGQLINLVK